MGGLRARRRGARLPSWFWRRWRWARPRRQRRLHPHIRGSSATRRSPPPAPLSHVPADFRLTCEIVALDKQPEPEGIVADAGRSPHDDAINGVEYEQFDSQEHVDAST